MLKLIDVFYNECITNYQVKKSKTSTTLSLGRGLFEYFKNLTC